MSLKSDFKHFFHDSIHVYSSMTGAYSPQVTQAEKAAPCALFVLHALHLSLFSSSWCQGLAAAGNCGTP